MMPSPQAAVIGLVKIDLPATRAVSAAPRPSARANSIAVIPTR